MKLVMVLMLAALPLYCYAGTGCQLVQEAVRNTLDSQVSVPQFLDSLRVFLTDTATANAMIEFKQCFLKQPKEILENVGLAIVI
ncbi:Secretoglobin family 2A member 1 [Tupaia chinensis]|uniref:Secretoglobin family 2A member 1 n=1 Tax=Tupaia chinensis TaxID=246437 RepID=L9JNH9_TUPCH|nr:Secretoglobin family 2A member 1 [Tupaia chinensis]